jgi:hypothetical protein
MIKPIIIDDFFEHPDLVRKFALKQNYMSPEEWTSEMYSGSNGGSWPGKRTVPVDELDEQLFDSVMQGILYATQNATARCEAQVFFQYCTEEDRDNWIHKDNLNWQPSHVGVIYLTPDPPDPKETGTFLYNEPEVITNNKDDWEVKYNFENKYNRCVIYDPADWHSAGKYFGKTIEDSKLFLVFYSKIFDNQ